VLSRQTRLLLWRESVEDILAAPCSSLAYKMFVDLTKYHCCLDARRMVVHDLVQTRVEQLLVFGPTPVQLPQRRAFVGISLCAQPR
jgi:hypothetical protein